QSRRQILASSFDPECTKSSDLERRRMAVGAPRLGYGGLRTARFGFDSVSGVRRRQWRGWLRRRWPALHQGDQRTDEGNRKQLIERAPGAETNRADQQGVVIEGLADDGDVRP